MVDISFVKKSGGISIKDAETKLIPHELALSLEAVRKSERAVIEELARNNPKIQEPSYRLTLQLAGAPDYPDFYKVTELIKKKQCLESESQNFLKEKLISGDWVGYGLTDPVLGDDYQMINARGWNRAKLSFSEGKAYFLSVSPARVMHDVFVICDSGIGEKQEIVKRGGRPTEKEEVCRVLDALDPHDPILQKQNSEISEYVALQCGEKIGNRNWKGKTIDRHIASWLVQQKIKDKTP